MFRTLSTHQKKKGFNQTGWVAVLSIAFIFLITISLILISTYQLKQKSSLKVSDNNGAIFPAVFPYCPSLPTPALAHGGRGGERLAL